MLVRIFGTGYDATDRRVGAASWAVAAPAICEGDGMTDPDDLVARLRAVGCVFAEEEAAEIRRVLGPGDPSAVVAARALGVPLEQALGRGRFAGVDVAVDPAVFVPRHRAAVLVDAAAQVAPGARVAVDLGCGSGAIAAALTRRLPQAAVHACDIDRAAVATAARNGAVFGFTAHQGDWWAALPGVLLGRVDLAVAYLPHVPTRWLGTIPRDFREHEPDRTVDGGVDGLDPFRAVLAGAPRWLAADGVLVTLVAGEQVPDALASAGGWRVEVRDLDGDADDEDDDRVLVLHRG
jgi:release factor glutamine methyltransferase